MLVDLAVKDFVSELSSANATPGGGSVSALGAALSSALYEMAVRISFSDIDEDMKDYMDILVPLKQDALLLIDADTDAFKQVMLAYALPKITDEDKKFRTGEIQKALKGASEVPFKTAELCMALLHKTAEVAVVCKESCVSDAAVAYNYAKSSFKGALYNVAINLASIKDKDFTEAMNEKVTQMNCWYEENCPMIDILFKERLGL